MRFILMISCLLFSSLSLASGPLSEEQKKQVINLFQSMTRANSLFSDLTEPDVKTNSEIYLKMLEAIKAACQVKQDSDGNGTITLAVEGQNCPVNMAMTKSFSKLSETEGKAHTEKMFKANGIMKDLNDVTELTSVQDFHWKYSENNGVQTFEGTSDLNGGFISQTLGNFEYRIKSQTFTEYDKTGEVVRATAETLFNTRLEDKEVELKIIVSSQGGEDLIEIYLNGEKIELKAN